MAQQTINVGAAPNDGTGTPLRTAFQYTNSNFSELYTATGPSGNNIVCPGSATITGDLNVSGNGAFTGTGYAALQRAFIPVGENGVTSLDFRWYSTGTTYTTGARVHSSSDAAWTASSTPARLMFSTVPSGSTSLSERYRIDNAGIHTWQNVGGVAGTAMTLNSTGLGVGSSPLGTAAGRGNVTINGSTDAILALGNAGVLTGYVAQSTLGMDIVGVGATFVRIQTNGNARLLVDSAGNFIPTLQATVPSLGLNSQMVFNLTSNTNLRISVRGTDGTTRTANITLA